MENLLESYLADMTNHATQLELLRHDLEQTEHLVRAAVIIIFIIIITGIIVTMRGESTKLSHLGERHVPLPFQIADKHGVTWCCIQKWCILT
jgi:hypothetical protein